MTCDKKSRFEYTEFKWPALTKYSNNNNTLAYFSKERVVKETDWAAGDDVEDEGKQFKI